MKPREFKDIYLDCFGNWMDRVCYFIKWAVFVFFTIVAFPLFLPPLICALYKTYIKE